MFGHVVIKSEINPGSHGFAKRQDKLLLLLRLLDDKMPKRSRDELEGVDVNKRLRSDPQDRLSALSDELLLVLLSYLPVHDLTRCERYVLKHVTSRDR